MTEELLEIRKDLSKKLKKERFEHTIGVMYTAASLAMRYGADIQKALTAGLLHDCGKYCSSKDQIRLCRKYDIRLTDPELEMPLLDSLFDHGLVCVRMYQEGVFLLAHRVHALLGDHRLEDYVVILYICHYAYTSSIEATAALVATTVLYFRISTGQYICLQKIPSGIWITAGKR